MTPDSISDPDLRDDEARPRDGARPGRRGPKQRLSTAAVVDAAIALADASGVAALSMRKVADMVGVSPMSLYTYVPSKAELVDMMLDRLLADTADPDDTMTGWREKLTFIAHERWSLSERHPWLLDLALHRPPPGPNVMRKAEVMLSAMEGMGLEPEEAGLAAETLQNYITGALRSARDARDAQRVERHDRRAVVRLHRAGDGKAPRPAEIRRHAPDQRGQAAARPLARRAGGALRVRAGAGPGRPGPVHPQEPAPGLAEAAPTL